ncbi:DUF58 domain-containing protein [Bacillus sp. M6-12]|uniref:DUF58 domain-containing protein n=1 Tax=Bacillus sp. M6-12 TaxID=2054166 RepID=UPI000C78CF06|nr:DUF58 domain-containing protein [Bacillus sp. M6-12]PLS14640.1 DUF58 domain-containing protein [Bacillus sp. M6-12]
MKKIFNYAKSYAKLLSLIVLFLAVFTYAMFQGGFVSWFLFYSFLPFVLYPILLFFYPVKNFKVEREFSKSECKSGESVEVTVTIARNFPFPLVFLLVEELLPYQLKKASSAQVKTLVFPWFKREIQLTYSLDGVPRGEHHFLSLRLKTGDFLGLFTKDATFDIPGRILTYPSYYEMSFRQLDNVFDQGQTSSSVRFQREQSMVSGVRDYQPGDRYSWINWKATAKRNDIMTKEFEERKSQDVFLLLDEQESALYEELIVYTASLVQAIIKNGVQVGYCSTGLAEDVLAVRGGDIQKQKLFYRLATSKPAAAERLKVVMNNSKMWLPFHVTLIVVTSQVTAENIEEISAISKNRSVTVYCLKKVRDLKKEEILLREAALHKGIKLKYIDYSFNNDDFSGVKAQ